ncbi:MAG: glycosyltransferase family 4 protein [Chitinophagales bacterium]|nr:glycosyltransferase family 4 protein [Chitinophagales bacterium]
MKFCFWGEIGNAIRGKTIGGGELQMALLGKALVQEGHEVVVIDPFIDASFTSEEGIRVLKVDNWHKGLPGLRMLTHRIPAMYKLFREQKADYYYLRMRTYLHGLAYLAARKNKRKVIVALASDIDVASHARRFRYDYKSRVNLFTYLFKCLPDDIVYNYVVKRADIVTLQHKHQHNGLKLKRGKMQVFPNIFDFSKLPAQPPEPGEYFISVGSLTVLKGVDHLCHLAQMLNKNSQLVIVGDPRNKAAAGYYATMQQLPHVQLKGRLGHADAIRLIAGAKALVNVSRFEGFPNIFLEAWANGIPVISLNVDPGNVISENGLGIFCNGDLQRLKDCVESGEVSAIDRQHLVAYAKQYHDFSGAGARFIKMLGN